MSTHRAESASGRRGQPGPWRWWWLVPVVLFGVLSCPREARTQDVTDPADPTPHSDAALVAERRGVRPGSVATVGLRITLDPGWHTYWRNPGDSGTEALLTWSLPAGFEAGPVLWPRPERVPAPPLMSYAYHDAVTLLTEVTVPANAAVGSTATLALRAEFLVCREICLPAAADLEARLPVVDRDPAPDPRWAAAFAEARALLPVEEPGWRTVAVETPAGYTLELTPPRGWAEHPADVYFFAFDPTALTHAEPQAPVWSGGRLLLTLVRSPYNTEPSTVSGVLVRADGGSFADAPGRPALGVEAPVERAADAAPQGAPVPKAPGPQPVASLLTALALALGGGVLLNLMPCVFPVLSLKIVGFVRHAAGDPRRTRVHGLAFAAGVVGSFLVLAAVLLAVRAGGAQVGWGFQLQSPGIVAALCVLLFGIGLVFAGVAEPGPALTRLAGVGADDPRYRGSLLTGVLATVVATPCTAPFMGAAIGIALLRPPVEGLAVFAAVGVGMAAPYVVLSSWPALLERIPRPGPWMETLKQVQAFPMFAVAAWLVWVFGLQTGVDGAAALLACLLLVAFGAWVLGHWPTPRGRARAVTRALAAAVFAAAAWAAWRGTQAQPPAAVAAGATWEAFGDGGVVARHRRAGRAVFVDFTAAWCISCQVNQRLVLSAPAVLGAFRSRDVALVKADWTRRDPDITRALASFGRSGVPLYVLYPSDPTAEPELLPAVLTHGIVLEALERVTAPRPEGAPAG